MTTVVIVGRTRIRARIKASGMARRRYHLHLERLNVQAREAVPFSSSRPISGTPRSSPATTGTKTVKARIRLPRPSIS